ncbi:MAG: hypothetical protein EOP07_20295, partial [Proteobacteria bacterium]
MQSLPELLSVDSIACYQRTNSTNSKTFCKASSNLVRRLLMQPEKSNRVQYSFFNIAGRTFAVDVIRVQEVVRPMQLTSLPLAPECIVGMINLRGQIAT